MRIGRKAVWPYGRIVLVAVLLAGPAAGQITGPNIRQYDFMLSVYPGASITGIAVITLNRHEPSDSVLAVSLVGM